MTDNTDNFTQHSPPLFDINLNGTNINDTNEEIHYVTAEKSHVIIYLTIGKWNLNLKLVMLTLCAL